MAVDLDPGVLVLTSLADGPKHGYAITVDIADSVGFSMGPGTLYGVLSRLEEAGMIQAMAAQGRRRPYRITAAGRRTLAEQARQMRTVANLGLRRLGTVS